MRSRNLEKTSRRNLRGVADLSTLAGFPELLDVGKVWRECVSYTSTSGAPDKSTVDGSESRVVVSLRGQVENLIGEKRALRNDAEKLKREVSHLEHLVDGLVRLLEGDWGGFDSGKEQQLTVRAHQSREKENGHRALPSVPMTPVFRSSTTRDDGDGKENIMDSAFDKHARAHGTQKDTPGGTTRPVTKNARTNYSHGATDSLRAWLDDTVRMNSAATKTQKRQPAVTNCALGTSGKALDFESFLDAPKSTVSIDDDVRLVLRNAEAFIEQERAR